MVINEDTSQGYFMQSKYGTVVKIPIWAEWFLFNLSTVSKKKLKEIQNIHRILVHINVSNKNIVTASNKDFQVLFTQ